MLLHLLLNDSRPKTREPYDIEDDTQMISIGRNVIFDSEIEAVMDEMIAEDVKRYERNARRRARYAEKKSGAC